MPMEPYGTTTSGFSQSIGDKNTDSRSSHNSERTKAEFKSKFADEFKITSILGAGGFGCVFEAENRFDGWKYAVKRVAVEANEATIDKALREVRAMAQFDHPGIVRYNSTWIEEPPEGWQYDSDEEMLSDYHTWNKGLMDYKDDDVFIYIQMQLCKYSLDTWLSENTTLSSRSLPRMKSWFSQIVSAVAYIHARNLIHRDLKPSNILFVDDDRLKLCDLGIATDRAIEDGVEVSVTRTCTGTRLYMSPEQRSIRSKYGSKTDIFALGLNFAELCVVMTPSERTKFFKYCRRGDPSLFIKDSTTAEFVEKLTQMEPANRPTCSEILDHPYLT